MSEHAANGHERLDAREKVTGRAAYTADLQCAGELIGELALSTVAAGRVERIGIEAALSVRGVVAVLTHENAPRVQHGEYRTWLQDARIHHAGQPIALVLAESARAARAGVARLEVRYAAELPRPRLTEGLAAAYVAPEVLGEPAHSMRGDLAAGRSHADAMITQVYATAANSHSPMEPHVAIARWEGERLLVHTATSGIFSARRVLAQALKAAVSDVRVVMRYQGGGFGAKGSAWWPTLILAASAARVSGRPVRVELTRESMFTVVGRRAPTVQRVTLGADSSGRLTLLEHEATQETSPLAEYSDPTCFASRSVYSCPNVSTRHQIVRVNAPQPNAMRAPGEGPGSFALESALDELAFALCLDPVELRLRNVAERDEHHDRSWSSNSLRACLLRGASAFGWNARAARVAPGRGGRVLVGQGMASAYYPVFQAGAGARVTIDASGTVTLYCGNQDIGTGSLTVMAQTVARDLGVATAEIRVQYGDTDLPETPMAAGSMGTASVIPAIERATRAVRTRVLRAAVHDDRSPLHGLASTSVHWKSPHELLGDNGARTSVAELARLLDCPSWEAEERSVPAEQSTLSGSAFGACFAQVEVDPQLSILRVSKLTGAFAAGRILNARLARSQYIGGMVFGIGMALHERIEEDATSGLPVNRHFTGYHLPVQADVPAIEVLLVEESDANSATHGIKGIGMIGTVGVAAAIANAVFDATGLRFRELPLSPEQLARAFGGGCIPRVSSVPL